MLLLPQVAKTRAMPLLTLYGKLATNIVWDTHYKSLLEILKCIIEKKQ